MYAASDQKLDTVNREQLRETLATSQLTPLALHGGSDMSTQSMLTASRHSAVDSFQTLCC